MNIPAQNTRLPLIGKIRVGEKAINKAGKEYPVSLDYFKATGSYASKFNDVYPSKPDRIQIVFISDDNFQSCYEEWDGRDAEGRRAGYGDGESYFLWQYGGTAYYEETDRKKIAEFSKQHAVKWRQVLTINFVIPAIKGVFGVWQLQTGGDKSSINAIRNTFDEIKELAGTVVNIPFDLCVKKVQSNKPEAKSVYPVISLVPNISAENMEQLRAFFEAGLDIKRAGMLTDQKLTALQQHTSNVITHPEAVVLNEAGSDYCPHCGAVEVDGLCSENCQSPAISAEQAGAEGAEKFDATLQKLADGSTDTVLTVQNARHTISSKKIGGGTPLDAAAATARGAAFEAEAKPATGVNEMTEFITVSKRIKNCRTQQELRELYAVEPLLQVEHNAQLENLWDEKFNELKPKADGPAQRE